MVSLSLNQQLSNLNGVGGCALANLVAAAPQGNTLFKSKVRANTANKYDILVAGAKRHRILLVCGIVYQAAACFFGNSGLNLLGGQLILGEYGNRDGVRTNNGHAHAGAGYTQLRQVLLTLILLSLMALFTQLSLLLPFLATLSMVGMLALIRFLLALL